MPLVSLILCLAAPMQTVAETAKIIRYPRVSATADPHVDYVIELLTLAIKHSGQTFQLVPNADPMQQARAIYEMSSKSGTIDVIWTMTTDERETQLLPIRIPIDKGLIGWRISLLSANNAELFREVTSLQDLSRFSAGQELDWPDVSILRNNGLAVQISTSYEPLFTMLKGGRFNYFPRSVFEINNELNSHPKLNLTIDKYLVLHYPSALYFFVTPREPKVAEAIQVGLEEITKNGAFEKTFQKHLSATIRAANIKQRTIIELQNPLLKTDKAPFNRPELWYHPDTK
ncbi:substrate-binding periplasmic protein [Undibacterium sp. Xuan67W]